MGSLFKFVEHQYMDEFFDTGSLRLGTIHSFRDLVEYGVSRGDEEEGKHHIKRYNDGVVTLRKDVHHPVISEIFKFEGEGESWIHGGTFIVPRVSPDSFVFCTSNMYSEGLFDTWYKKEKLDSCYEILNPHGFIAAISRVIESSTYFVKSSNVFYTQKEIDYQSPEANLHPAITKRRDLYEWQKEHRFIWGVRLPSPPLKPWIIKAPEARQYCRRLANWSDSGPMYLK